jgi:hypothetical protein
MQRPPLTAISVKHRFAVALQVDHPLITSVAEVSGFFKSRHIQVECLQVQDHGKLGGGVYLEFHLEKDRLKHTLDLLSALRSVLALEEVNCQP